MYRPVAAIVRTFSAASPVMRTRESAKCSAGSSSVPLRVILSTESPMKSTKVSAPGVVQVKVIVDVVAKVCSEVVRSSVTS